MYTVILMIHVLTAVMITVLVLVQKGKGSAFGGQFGGASQTLFGSRGSNSFLLKLTLSCAGVFVVTSISLNYLAAKEYRNAGLLSHHYVANKAMG